MAGMIPELFDPNTKTQTDGAFIDSRLVEDSSPERYVKDSLGQEHAPAGHPEGGRFVADDIDNQAASSGVASAEKDFRGILERMNSGAVDKQVIEGEIQKLAGLSRGELAELLPKLHIQSKPKSKANALELIKQVLDSQYHMYLSAHPNSGAKLGGTG